MCVCVCVYVCVCVNKKVKSSLKEGDKIKHICTHGLFLLESIYPHYSWGKCHVEAWSHSYVSPFFTIIVVFSSPL